MDLAVDVVGKANEELSTSECVDLVIDPFLGEGAVVGAMSMTCLVQGLNELEEVRGAVEVPITHFSVERVITTCKTLLTSVIEEWDASCCQ